tara:strand:- start:261 stop:1118 length:858 start_codon:yes stop_codon:yes gene_type:complete
MINVKDCSNVGEVLTEIGADKPYQLRPIAEFPRNRGVFDGNDNPVAIVSHTYPLLQPAKAFEYVDTIRGELGYDFDKAGFANHGRKLFLSLRKKNALVIDPKVDDVLDEVIYFWTAFDGSMQTLFNQMIERLVCANGMVTMDVQSSAKVKHSSLQEGKLDDYVKEVIDIQGVFQSSYDAIQRLVDTKIKDKDAKEVIGRLFKGESKKSEIIREDVFGRFQNGLGNRGETAWDLLNGITEYQNHGKTFRTSENKSISASENRFKSLTTGGDAKMMQTIWNECLSLN